MVGTQREREQIIGAELGLAGVEQVYRVQVSRVSFLGFILKSVKITEGD